MRILYDFQAFNLQEYGGISRYFYELLLAYKASESVDCDLLCLYSNNHYIKSFSIGGKTLRDLDFPYRSFMWGLNFKWKEKLFHLRNKTFNILPPLAMNKYLAIKSLKDQNYDLFHPTYYHPYFLQYIGDKPFVLTVYDMIHEIYSEYFSPTDKTKEWKRLLAQKAKKIIAISENTKKDLIKLYGLSDKKIEVIHLGNSLETQTHTQTAHIKLPSKYILFVGNRSAYKNFNFFIKAVTSLLKQDKDLHIICTGGGHFSPEEQAYFESLNIEGQIQQYSIDDSTLAFFYKKALAFVFPSLYEGFGLPVLEAFSCGCPVILSNTSSLPEIAQNAGYYFDPTNEGSMREAIIRVINDKELRTELIGEGYQQLKLFSWENTAQKTRELYLSCM